MKRLFTMLALAICSPAFAQTSISFAENGYFIVNDDIYYGATVVDTSSFAVKYDMKMMCDSLKKEVKTYPAILQVGKKVWKFQSYWHFQIDSLMAAKGSGSAHSGAAHDPVTCYDCWFLNFPSGKYTFTGRLGADNYRYVAPQNRLKWTLRDSSRTISGYAARMAKCSLAGREWTAWYTFEIPVSSGPWRLSGLPGLILEASSDDGTYLFSISGLSRTAFPITMSDYDYTDLTRKQFRKLQNQMFRSFAEFFNFHNGGTGILLFSPASDNPGDGYVPQYDLIEME